MLFAPVKKELQVGLSWAEDKDANPQKQPNLILSSQKLDYKLSLETYDSEHKK